MKKIAKEELIKLLKDKKNYTYDELAKISGYHPKSIIRINSKLKHNNYQIKKNTLIRIGMEIKDDYLSSHIKSYKDFYAANKEKYNISYSLMCRILNTLKTNEDIVLIKKIKEKNNYHFKIIDYQNNTLLFTFPSLKNDILSTKRILYKILSAYGRPDNICFCNYLNKNNESIDSLLHKYHVNHISYKPIYQTSSNNNLNIKYFNIKIDKKDFYNHIKRRTIDDNTIQFKNIRYIINPSNIIKRLTITDLYYNDDLTDLFIVYNDKSYELTQYKELTSKKGASKY